MFLKRSFRIGSLVVAGLLAAQSAFANCNPHRGNCWGVLAAGEWLDSDGGSHVAVGAAWDYNNINAAQAAAIEQCRDRGGENCEYVTSFHNGGCAYITTGTDDNGVTYQSAATSDEAYNLCTSRGYDCNTPIGGCASGG